MLSRRAGHVEAEEQAVGERQLGLGAADAESRYSSGERPCSASSCSSLRRAFGGHQPHLVECEAGLDADRERARDDLQVELAVVAGGDLVEAVVAVGEHAREHVQAPGRALRVGLRADLARAGAAPRSAARGRGGRARAWRRRAGRSVRTPGPRSSPRPSSRCRAGSCSAAPRRARRAAGRRSRAAPTPAGCATGRRAAIRARSPRAAAAPAARRGARGRRRPAAPAWRRQAARHAGALAHGLCSSRSSGQGV